MKIERRASRYEITWASGRVETITAHQISHRDSPGRTEWHAEIDGHWTLLLWVRDEDIRTIRCVTEPVHTQVTL